MGDMDRIQHDWDPDTALTALADEAGVMDYSPAEQATKVFEQGVALAATSIMHIAMHSPNEKLRLDASRYVVDRLLGRVGEEKVTSTAKDPFEALLGDVIMQVEEHANGGMV